MVTVRALKNPEVNFSKIFNSIDLGVIIISKATGCIVQANHKCAELFGFKLQEGTLVGLSFSDLCITDSEQERAFQPSHLELEGFLSNIVLMNVDGEPVSFDVTVAQGHGDNSDFVILTLRTVEQVQTLLKNLKEKNIEMDSILKTVQRQNEQLVKLDEMKNQFISLMSHELRTPLSGMIGYLELILNKLVDAKEQEEYLKIVHKEGLRLSDIVNDFLDLSKMIAGKMEFHVSEVEVSEILQTATLNMNGFAQKRKVEILVKDESIPHMAFADRGRLLQVFLNVLNNAVKFSHEGGRVETWIEKVNDETLRVFFADTGIGIREKDYPKVFADFEMVESLQEHQKGTGLGMPLCKRFMEAMGGGINFKSEFGIGTTFWVDIPTQKILDPSFYSSAGPGGSQVIF